jgi:hypothetical protein
LKERKLPAQLRPSKLLPVALPGMCKTDRFLNAGEGHLHQPCPRGKADLRPPCYHRYRRKTPLGVPPHLVASAVLFKKAKHKIKQIEQ